MKERNEHPLRIARVRNNLTIEQLAEVTRVGASTIWRAEHGHPISARSRQMLCEYFHMTSEELGLAEKDGRDSRDQVEASLPHLTHQHSSPTSASSLEQDHTFYQLHSHGTKNILSQQQETTPKNQLSTWLALGSIDLAALFDAGWTVEAILNSLRVVLQGVRGIPPSTRNTLLQLGSTAFIHTLNPPSEEHISQDERLHLCTSLDKGVSEAWHLFHTACPSQVLVVAQTLLSLVKQTHSLLPPEFRSSLYAGLYNLIGAVFLFQGQYAAARRAHEKAHIAALEGADIWNMAQSLNWQAIVSQVCDRYSEAIQFIAAALRLITYRDEEVYLRLRAHLLADWAYNAALLHEHISTHEQLEASASLLEPLGLHEEFDRVRWHQIAGSCLLLEGNYTDAITHLEQSLRQLPHQWLTRRLLTLLPLAEAYARSHERNASLTTAQHIASLLPLAEANMLNRRFTEYQQVLINQFPHDQHIQKFLLEIGKQAQLPQHIRNYQHPIQ